MVFRKIPPFFLNRHSSSLFALDLLHPDASPFFAAPRTTGRHAVCLQQRVAGAIPVVKELPGGLWGFP